MSHGEAEDVLQDTFAAMIQRGAAPEQPEFYCLRAFRNRAFNFRRSLWRRVLRELESAWWFEGAEAESPRERAAMRELAGLPVEQREAIVLKVWHQHTFEEIGAMLGISPNTVAGRYRYGLQKLRMSMREDEYEQLEFDRAPIAMLEAARPVAET